MTTNTETKTNAFGFARCGHPVDAENQQKKSRPKALDPQQTLIPNHIPKTTIRYNPLQIRYKAIQTRNNPHQKRNNPRHIRNDPRQRIPLP